MLGIGTAEELLEVLSEPLARDSELVCCGFCSVADLVVPSDDRRLRSSSRACMSAFTRKLLISSTRCSCEIPLMEAPLRTVTLSVFARENRGCPELAGGLLGVSDTVSAGADCLVLTAVKPMGGDCEGARYPLGLIDVPLATSGYGTGLTERGRTLTTSASRRLIIAAFLFFKR